MAVDPIPQGFHAVTPYLSIKGAKDAIAFYIRAFGAHENYRLPMPNGDIAHAELSIGGSPFMLSEPCEESPMPSPSELGGTSIGMHLYVEDVDAIFKQALEAGAEEIKPVADQFYGDRTGTLKDPFGHVWFIATHKEDLSPEQIGQRAAAMFDADNDE